MCEVAWVVPELCQVGVNATIARCVLYSRTSKRSAVGVRYYAFCFLSIKYTTYTAGVFACPLRQAQDERQHGTSIHMCLVFALYERKNQTAREKSTAVPELVEGLPKAACDQNAGHRVCRVIEQ